MPLVPRVAPQYEPPGRLHGGNRMQQHLHQHQQQRQEEQRKLPLPWSAAKFRRRRRSRSLRASRIAELRRGSGSRNLAGLMLGIAALAVVIFVPVVALSRSVKGDLPRGEYTSSGDSVHANLEVRDQEEALLRREVQRLENDLVDKKTMLGIAPGLPLEDRSDVDGRGQPETLAIVDARPQQDRRNTDVSAGASGNGQALPQALPPGRSPTPRDQRNRQHQQQLLDQDHSPPKTDESLAGDAVFGSGELPLRQSLESQPGLIREPVPLIVGGTDGSGTRGVVALLERLNVPMVVEDKGTMDVHGAPYMVKGGWPAVVRPVIQWAKGTGYEPRVAPEGLRRATFDALGKLRVEMDKLSRKIRSPGNGNPAKHVTWGFKAPVSMVLVPFFQEAWGRAKFLHVVRDGRDIAFSGNQTPVEKFFKDMFPEGTRESRLKEPSAKAMAMWNSWNLGVHHWAYTQKQRGVTGMDYLLLHAEDLLDPAAKYAAVKDVAEFVGSPLSDFELCCLATEGYKDMGSHTAKKKDRGIVTSRFGKWKGKVEGKPGLSRLLHTEGETGLRTFGYEPERSLRASTGFECAAERDAACPEPPSPDLPARASRPSRPGLRGPVAKPPATVDDTATCVGLKVNIDFQGSDLEAGHAREHLDCCAQCQKAHGCSHFTFDYSSSVCYLKSGKGVENSKGGLVSGMVS